MAAQQFRSIRMAAVRAAATRTRTPPVANKGAACADVVAHRAGEPLSGWLDGSFGPKANPVRPIKLVALVQRCFCLKSREVHFVVPLSTLRLCSTLCRPLLVAPCLLQPRLPSPRRRAGTVVGEIYSLTYRVNVGQSCALPGTEKATHNPTIRNPASTRPTVWVDERDSTLGGLYGVVF
jgi:hypothetical protein